MRVWVDPIKLAARGDDGGGSAGRDQSAPTSCPRRARPKNVYVASPITAAVRRCRRRRLSAHCRCSSDGRQRGAAARRSPGGTGRRKHRRALITFNGTRPEPSWPFSRLRPPIRLTTAAADPEELVPMIQETLPARHDDRACVYDSTEQISASIEEVFKTIGEAVAHRGCRSSCSSSAPSARC